MYHFRKVSYILTYYCSVKLYHLSTLKKKKRKGNIMYLVKPANLPFLLLQQNVNTSTFCQGCLGNFAYFFSFGEFNVYLNAPFHYRPGLFPSSSLLTPDLSWLFCGDGWLLVIQTCLWLISVSNQMLQSPRSPPYILTKFVLLTNLHYLPILFKIYYLPPLRA